MRRFGRPAVAGILLLLVSPWPAGAGQVTDVAGRVDRAIRILLSPEPSDTPCTDGLASLLDALVAAAPAARVDGAWLPAVAKAREIVAGGRLGPASPLLHDAYVAVFGKPFAVPAGLGSMPEVNAHLRRQLSSVRGLLDEGRADEAVRRMLESAVMVVTPIER